MNGSPVAFSHINSQAPGGGWYSGTGNGIAFAPAAATSPAAIPQTGLAGVSAQHGVPGGPFTWFLVFILGVLAVQWLLVEKVEGGRDKYELVTTVAGLMILYATVQIGRIFSKFAVNTIPGTPAGLKSVINA